MLSHNAGAILRRMRARGTAVALQSQASARELAPELAAEARRIIQEEIYSPPIPLKAKAPGKFANTRTKQVGGRSIRQWERTGELLRGEKAVTRGVTIILTNNAKHGGPRHRLGTPQGRAIRSPGVKSVQWRTQTLENMRARIVEVRRQGVLRGLRRR
jgi:hypothetical protein